MCVSGLIVGLKVHFLNLKLNLKFVDMHGDEDPKLIQCVA